MVGVRAVGEQALGRQVRLCGLLVGVPAKSRLMVCYPSLPPVLCSHELQGAGHRAEADV